MKDKAIWKVRTLVKKFKEDISPYRGGREHEFYERHKPYEVVQKEGNVLLNAGIDELWDLVTGAGGTAYSSANAHIGVGDSSAAADASQTDLQGTNKKWNPMDAGYPTSTNQKATWRASFADGDANFTWNEWGVCNASGTAAGGTLLNRKVENLGTKNGGTWQLTVEISLS